jgi:hypothetical protein
VKQHDTAVSPPTARRCVGCGRLRPNTCMSGALAGYWHLGCLRRVRRIEQAEQKKTKVQP